MFHTPVHKITIDKEKRIDSKNEYKSVVAGDATHSLKAAKNTAFPWKI
jgi:hypothetical protein